MFTKLNNIWLKNTSKNHIRNTNTTISCINSSVSLFVYRYVKKLHSAPLNKLQVLKTNTRKSKIWFRPVKSICGDPLKHWMTFINSRARSIFMMPLFTVLRVLSAGPIVFERADVKWVCQCAHWPIYQVNSLQVTITVKWEHVPINSTARPHIRSLSVPLPIESTCWCHAGFLSTHTFSHISLYVLYGDGDKSSAVC